MAEVDHETVYFSGRVQGVGFRYNVLQVAKEYEVCGFVQNIPDGRVLVEVEGLAAEIGEFVTAIESRMHGFVRQVERRAMRRAAIFKGFQIR
ncbi:acylphosphatase [Synoicihabitans lomoniglobus]|uniref:acylphosphatase n=1 Tax=Synoicihabitans lomoniglobus TaxID=2909285 RepID=A0AAF0CSB4_9BACT|nr:acylphosphatase [Opitutaceae bacterium LMO-M01]WED67193.1 acylphosphatase [Opitutaceae bacterium LMO-M01]